MRKILLLIALIVPNILWAAGADSTRASLHIVKRGDSTLVRSTARIVPEDSVVIGNPRTPVKKRRKIGRLKSKTPPMLLDMSPLLVRSVAPQ